MSDINEDDYLKSLGPDNILNCFWTNNFSSLYELCSSGKSGSLFYYTEDQQYMLKTVSKEEFKKLKAILKGYYEHLFNNPTSLITRFYGLHKVECGKKRHLSFTKKYLVVMNNVFRGLDVGNRYDLKGSTQGRRTFPIDKNLNDPDRDEKIAFKDLDFIQNVKQIELISINT